MVLWNIFWCLRPEKVGKSEDFFRRFKEAEVYCCIDTDLEAVKTPLGSIDHPKPMLRLTVYTVR